MADHGRDVKAPDERKKRLDPARWARDLLHFIDCHPRAGWMWFGLMIANTIINLLDLFH
jgi:hypothetical protein